MGTMAFMKMKQKISVQIFSLLLTIKFAGKKGYKAHYMLGKKEVGDNSGKVLEGGGGRGIRRME